MASFRAWKQWRKSKHRLPIIARDRRKPDPTLIALRKSRTPHHRSRQAFRSVGMGLITGAADDDPAAIGTYSAAGAALGPGILWSALWILPLTFTVVYLASKVGQVTGQGLFEVIRLRYSRRVLFALLLAAALGNMIEAGADLGGIAAGIHLLWPVKLSLAVLEVGAAVLVLQIQGYAILRNIFRVVTLSLLAYIGSGWLARPDWRAALAATLLPHFEFNREFLSLLVAIIGSNLSAYLLTWQSNQDVEEDIRMGRRRLSDRAGTTAGELRRARYDIALGVFFSDLVMYFILLAAASTLFPAGQFHIQSAAQAARALQPLAGPAAGWLFAAGIIGAGFLALPVMTIGAAFDICQSLGWKHGLRAKPREAPAFYITAALITLAEIGMNMLGFNPMRALVYAGIVQGISTPFLLLAVLRITQDSRVMGPWVNSRTVNLMGWVTILVMFAAGLGLLISFL